MKGFLLGLSNGAACLAYCAPSFVPLLMGEGKGVLRNYSLLVQFLSGRLAGYLLFAVLAWGVHQTLWPALQEPILPIAALYLLFSVLLIVYGFRSGSRKDSASCEKPQLNAIRSVFEGRRLVWLPVAAGFVTGLSFCPPFLLAFTGALEESNLVYGMLFFAAFFVGTSVFLFPLPLWGLFRKVAVLKTIGRMAAGLMGIYYFYYGSVMLIGGLHL
jgi:sulfite exporter TauE/SafE